MEAIMRLAEVTNETFIRYLLHDYLQEKSEQDALELEAFFQLALKKTEVHKRWFEQKHPGQYETRCNPFTFDHVENLTPILYIQAHYEAFRTTQQSLNPPTSAGMGRRPT